MGRSARACALLLLTAALAGAGRPASPSPQDWRLDPATSTIGFDYVLADRPAHGAFGVLSGHGRFDPDRPETTRLTLVIAVDSLDLGDPLWNVFATGPLFFGATDHPEAVYRLVSLTPLEGEDWEALGDLTIRGRTLPLRTLVALSVTANEAHAVGQLDVLRSHFGVGGGPAELLVSIGDTVSVRFDLTARPGG